MIESEMTLHQWLIAGGKKAENLYAEWLQNPMTQRVISFQRFEARPEPAPIEALMTNPTEVTLAKHSELIGRHTVLDNIQQALRKLPGPVPETEEATYGAEDTVSEEYGDGFFPTEEDA